MAIKLGIDFGTSNIVVSTLLPGEGDESCVFDCWDESYLLCSDVGLEDQDNPIVGGIATENWEGGNKHCYRRFNLDIGRNSENYAPGYPTITPELLTLHLIEHINKTLLGEKQSMRKRDTIDEVVVTVPYGCDQQESIKKAFTDAGLKVKSLVSKPVAAAAYYSYLHQKGDQVVLVCDIGDKTLNLSLVRVIENKKIEVIDSESYGHAGMWADALIAKQFADEFNRRYGFKITTDAQQLLQMTDDADIMGFLREANRVKQFLNNKRVSMMNNKRASVPTRKPLPEIVPLSYKHMTLELQLGYERLEETLTPIVEAGKAMIQALLNTHSDNPPDSVVMVGGMGKMHLLQEMVAEVTGYSLQDLMNFGKEADKTVARGAALAVYDKMQIEAVLPYSLAVATPAYDREGKLITGKYENTIIVKKGKKIPFENYKGEVDVFFETVKPWQKSIDVAIISCQGDNIEHGKQMKHLNFELPMSVPKGERYEFAVSIDEDGIITVGIEGEGVSGEISLYAGKLYE